MTVIQDVSELSGWIGKEVAVSECVDVSQARIDAFAEVTEDRQWIHVDPERAKAESLFGTTIAHGFLILSLLPAMMARAVEIKGGFKGIINCGLKDVKFRRPIPSAAHVFARFALESSTPVAMGTEAVWAVKIGCEGDEKVYVEAGWVLRYLR